MDELINTLTYIFCVPLVIAITAGALYLYLKSDE